MQHFGGNPDDEGGARGRTQADMLVPAHRAGLIIGHHGESLKRIEKLSQCTIQFDCADDVEEAKRLVLEKVDDNLSRYPSVQMMIPQGRVGLIIGRGGETIRELQERSGARITVQPESQVDPFAAERSVTLCGDDESIQRAKDMIHEMLTGQSRGGFPGVSGRSGNTVTISIPESSVGAVIGRRADTLRTLQNMSGCKINVETASAPGSGVRNVHLNGAPEQIAYANQLIMEKVAQNEGTYYGYESAGQIYQNPAEFTQTAATDPNAGYDYAQYYYYYQQQMAAANGGGQVDPSQQQQYQQAYDYAAQQQNQYQHQQGYSEYQQPQ